MDIQARSVCIVANKALVKLKTDVLTGRSNIEERTYQVSPMNVQIRGAISSLRGSCHRNGENTFAGTAPAQFEVLRFEAELANLLTDSQGIQYLDRIGAELNACANVFKCACLFDKRNSPLLAGKRQRCAQAAYAGANNNCVTFFQRSVC